MRKKYSEEKHYDLLDTIPEDGGRGCLTDEEIEAFTFIQLIDPEEIIRDAYHICSCDNCWSRYANYNNENLEYVREALWNTHYPPGACPPFMDLRREFILFKKQMKSD